MNTIIHFLKKFSLNNFILLNLDKIKDLVCFQITCNFNNYFNWIYYDFCTFGKCLHLQKSSEISNSFQKALKMFKNYLYAFLNFSKNLWKFLEIFEKFPKFLKSFFKLFCEFWKFFEIFIMPEVLKRLSSPTSSL